MERSSETFDEIEARWDKWRKVPFPDSAFDLELMGIELASIDTFSAGCISVYVENRGKLDQWRIDILRKCSSDLDAVLGQLTGEVKNYFTELSEISHKVLDSKSA